MITLMKLINPPLSEFEQIRFVLHGLKPTLKGYMMDKKFNTMEELEDEVMNIEMNFQESSSMYKTGERKFPSINQVSHGYDPETDMEPHDEGHYSDSEYLDQLESINQVTEGRDRRTPYCTICRIEGHRAEYHRKECKILTKDDVVDLGRDGYTNNGGRTDNNNGRNQRNNRNRGNRDQSRNERQGATNQGPSAPVAMPMIAQVQLVPYQQAAQEPLQVQSLPPLQVQQQQPLQVAPTVVSTTTTGNFQQTRLANQTT
jgi:hypothetical protein